MKVMEQQVVMVEAKHEERLDPGFGSVSRYFLHRYRLPACVDPASIRCHLSKEGILTVFATKVSSRPITTLYLTFTARYSF